MTDHALTQMFRPPAGRRLFGLVEIDGVLDQATKVKYNGATKWPTVAVGAKTPFVVVDAAAGRRGVTAVFKNSRVAQ